MDIGDVYPLGPHLKPDMEWVWLKISSGLGGVWGFRKVYMWYKITNSGTVMFNID